jgi:magnesium chelatase family protein
VVNAELTPAQIDVHCALDVSTSQFAQRAAAHMGWSGRSLHRVIKLARTVADLDAWPSIDASHLSEAMQLRRGLPEP